MTIVLILPVELWIDSRKSPPQALPFLDPPQDPRLVGHHIVPHESFERVVERDILADNVNKNENESETLVDKYLLNRPNQTCL